MLDAMSKNLKTSSMLIPVHCSGSQPSSSLSKPQTRTIVSFNPGQRTLSEFRCRGPCACVFPCQKRSRKKFSPEGIFAIASCMLLWIGYFDAPIEAPAPSTKRTRSRDGLVGCLLIACHGCSRLGIRRQNPPPRSSSFILGQQGVLRHPTAVECSAVCGSCQWFTLLFLAVRLPTSQSPKALVSGALRLRSSAPLLPACPSHLHLLHGLSNLSQHRGCHRHCPLHA